MTAVSKKDFAELYGCGKSYVSQLVKDSRLVLVDDGRLVDVEKSFELLGVTSDPSKAGVRERWAAYRAGSESAGTATAAGAPPAPPVALADAGQLTLDDQPAAVSAAGPAEAPRNTAYHDARTMREQAQAQMAQIELGKQLGTVLDAETTLRAVMDAHVAARAEIMKLPDRLAQLVAAQSNPRACFELIRVECERACKRMVDAARGLANAEQIAQANAAAPANEAQPAEVPA
ncbi:hypothetical protein [Roseateles sp. P5_E7]